MVKVMGNSLYSSARSPQTLMKYAFPVGLALVGLYVLVWAVRTTMFGGLWLDELTSIAYAHPDKTLLWVLKNNFNSDVHPPLYYVLLHGWMSFFGTSDVIVRAFSMICYLLTVALPFLIPSKTIRGETALAASVILACHPVLILSGQDARMYALMVLLTTAATLVALRLADEIRDTGKISYKRAAQFLFVSLCLAYTHYWGVLITGALVGSMMILALPRWRLVVLIAIGGFLVLFAFLLWFIPMISARGGAGRYDTFLPYVDMRESFRQIRSLAFPLTNKLGWTWTDTLDARRNLAWILSSVLVAISVILSLGQNARQRGSLVIIATLLLTWWSASVINQFVVVQKTNSATGLISIAMLATVTFLMTAQSLNIGRILVICQVGVILITVPFDTPIVREHWRETARVIDGFESCKGDSFYAVPFYEVPDTSNDFHLRYYLQSDAKLLKISNTSATRQVVESDCPVLIWANHVFRPEVDRAIESLVPQNVNIEVIRYPRSFLVLKTEDPLPVISYADASSTIFDSGARWNSNGSTVIEDRSLVIRFAAAMTASALDIALDSNDRYRVKLIQNDQVLGSIEIELDPSTAGLTRRTIDIPTELRGIPFDSIAVQPVEGDGYYSLGHLLLIENQ